jgi:hypothetical protein
MYKIELDKTLAGMEVTSFGIGGVAGNFYRRGSEFWVELSGDGYDDHLDVSEDLPNDLQEEYNKIEDEDLTIRDFIANKIATMLGIPTEVLP